MINLQQDIQKRAGFIKKQLKDSGACGVVFGNSGGKDSALAGIIAKMAVEKVIGVIMPCGSRRNFEEDMQHALEFSKAFGITDYIVDLTAVKNTLCKELEKNVIIDKDASANINPRLRMTALYAVAQSHNCLVMGTSNKSEIHLGYFTKWGDGGYDFNPISDLTATQTYKYLEFLGAPPAIINKPPSAALYDGQTDEADMGMTYSQIDTYIQTGSADAEIARKIDGYHKRSAHKRKMPAVFKTTD